MQEEHLQQRHTVLTQHFQQAVAVLQVLDRLQHKHPGAGLGRQLAAGSRDQLTRLAGDGPPPRLRGLLQIGLHKAPGTQLLAHVQDRGPVHPAEGFCEHALAHARRAEQQDRPALL